MGNKREEEYRVRLPEHSAQSRRRRSDRRSKRNARTTHSIRLRRLRPTDVVKCENCDDEINDGTSLGKKISFVVVSWQTDVTGTCPVEYELQGSSWGTKTIKKTKDLLGCTEHVRQFTAFQSTPYNVESVSPPRTKQFFRNDRSFLIGASFGRTVRLFNRNSKQ